MDQELQRYYDDRFNMMAQRGWQDLVEDLTRILEQYQNIDNCGDTVTLEYRKGQVDILKYLVNLKELSEKAYEEIK
jgi:ferritin-like protein